MKVVGYTTITFFIVTYMIMLLFVLLYSLLSLSLSIWKFHITSHVQKPNHTPVPWWILQTD